MLARRLTPILPAMTLAEAIATTRMHRVAGLTGDRTTVVTTRPCRAPHQTISAVGLLGGGHLPRPGEVSRAHHGRLFLDELPEFRRHVLEVLPIRLRRASQEYNRRRVIDLAALAALVAFLEVRVEEQSR
jgi:magnesium chelatase family protein